MILSRILQAELMTVSYEFPRKRQKLAQSQGKAVSASRSTEMQWYVVNT